MTQTNLKNNPSSSLLKNTRLSKGLTLEIVHEATKVPMDALKAIEEGYSTRILTPFYYRGFIKIYAEFLGLNISDVLTEYNVQSPAMKSAIKPTVLSRPIPSSLTKPKAQVPSISIPTEGLQEIWRNVWTARNRKNLLRILAGVVALVVLVKIAGCIAHVIKSRPKATVMAPVKGTKKHIVKKEEPKQETKAVEQEAPAPVTASAEPQTMSAQSQNHKVTLAVHASKDTWIQVKTDGKVAFQMTMKKGTVENWEAKNDIELSGKNIGDLDLEVNGQDVSHLGTLGRHPKKVLITKNGLTVKK